MCQVLVGAFGRYVIHDKMFDARSVVVSQTMRSHPGRCVQAIERIQEVLRAEFDDLEPPDCVFVLSQLLWSFHEATDRSLKGAKEGLR